jgi:hypothetical protein
MNNKLIVTFIIAILFILPTCGKRITKPLIEVENSQTNSVGIVTQPPSYTLTLASIVGSLAIIAVKFLGMIYDEEPEPCIVAVPNLTITKPQLMAIRSRQRGKLLPQFEKLTIDWWQWYRQIFNEQETIEIFDEQIRRHPLPAAYQQRIQQYLNQRRQQQQQQ